MITVAIGNQHGDFNLFVKTIILFIMTVYTYYIAL